jgi:hypothetical protein
MLFSSGTHHIALCVPANASSITVFFVSPFMQRILSKSEQDHQIQVQVVGKTLQLFLKKTGFSKKTRSVQEEIGGRQHDDCLMLRSVLLFYQSGALSILIGFTTLSCTPISTHIHSIPMGNRFVSNGIHRMATINTGTGNVILHPGLGDGLPTTCC